MQTLAATLEERIGVAVDRSPYLDRQEISIDDIGQCVAVRGVVTSYYEKQMAQETLLRVDGVEAVDNHLEVICRQARRPDLR